MNKEVATCPVTGAKADAKETKCPIHGIFDWFREQVAFATTCLPLHKNTAERKRLVKASCHFSELIIPIIRDLIPVIQEHIDTHFKDKKTRHIVNRFFLSHNNRDIREVFIIELLEAQMSQEEGFGIPVDLLTKIQSIYRTGISLMIKSGSGFYRLISTDTELSPLPKPCNNIRFSSQSSPTR